MALYVYSKMAAGVEYVDWLQGGGDLPVKGQSVVIHGGAGIANKNLITPLGVVTEITEEEAEILNRNFVFNMHRKNGFVTIEHIKDDVEKVLANMTPESDPSAPLTPADFDIVPDAVAKPMGKSKR